MKKQILLNLLVVFTCQISQGQAYCSKNFSKVFFGPDNVIFEKSDPSTFYINEINLTLDSLNKRAKLDDSTIQKERRLLKDIKALESLKQDWIKWAESINPRNKSVSKIKVKEFFYFKEIGNPKAKYIRGGHSIDRNCLHSDPKDCLFYGRIKKWEIVIEDDFGNVFIPGFHRFSNVGLATIMASLFSIGKDI